MRDIKELEDLIRYHNKVYTAGRPEITDAEYDDLIEALRDADPENEMLLEVGAPSFGKKIKHEIPMGSLAKVKELPILNKWYVEHDDEVIWTEKIDGCSGELVFKDGKLVQASTRGNGLEGSDVTDNVLETDICKTTLKVRDCVVRGEFYIKKSFFQKNLAAMAANARNMVSGSIQLKNPKDIKGRGVSFKVFRVLNPRLETLERELIWAKDAGFDVVRSSDGKLTSQIIDLYEDGYRDSLDYDIDGLVVMVNSTVIRDNYGLNGNNPKGAIAFKFKPETVAATVLDIEWSLGRSGRVTPVALLEPIKLAGSVIARCTLHNHREMRKLGIVPGCKVALRKGGDVIPDIEKKIAEPQGFSVPPVFYPSKCPCCDSMLRDDGVTYHCDNIECGDKLLSGIIHYLKALDTKEVGESIISQLIEAKKVKSVADLYRVKAKDFVGLPGVGSRTVEIYMKVIDSIREVELGQFIRGLGMESIGRTLSKVFAKKFGSIDKVFNVTKDELFTLEGIAEISANKILDELSKKAKQKDDLLTVVKVKEAQVIQGSLTGKKFCCTGGISIPRSQIQKMIEALGAEYSSIKRGLDYLIIGDDAVPAKVEKARKLGAKILNEADFMKIIK